jgi:hypothetical protein
MRVAGSKSWMLRFDVPEEPHVALFVRDALRLGADAETAGEQPPSLEGGVPDQTSLVTAAERERLKLAYPSWWQTSFDGAALLARGQEAFDDAMERHRQLDEASTRFYAPLARHAELRRDARDWLAEHRGPHERPDSDLRRRNWEIARDAAEAAAAERGVEPGELAASTWLLLVQGVWWATPAAGRLVYSPAVRDDAELLSNLLRETFGSSLGR